MLEICRLAARECRKRWKELLLISWQIINSLAHCRICSKHSGQPTHQVPSRRSVAKQSAERQVVDHGRTVHFEVQGSLPPSENHVNPLTIIGKKKLQEHLYFPNAVHCTWNPLIAWQSHLIPAKSSLHPSICFRISLSNI